MGYVLLGKPPTGWQPVVPPKRLASSGNWHYFLCNRIGDMRILVPVFDTTRGGKGSRN